MHVFTTFFICETLMSVDDSRKRLTTTGVIVDKDFFFYRLDPNKPSKRFSILCEESMRHEPKLRGLHDRRF
jgi:hypothetical protein